MVHVSIFPAQKSGCVKWNGYRDVRCRNSRKCIFFSFWSLTFSPQVHVSASKLIGRIRSTSGSEGNIQISKSVKTASRMVVESNEWITNANRLTFYFSSHFITDLNVKWMSTSNSYVSPFQNLIRTVKYLKCPSIKLLSSAVEGDERRKENNKERVRTTIDDL